MSGPRRLYRIAALKGQDLGPLMTKQISTDQKVWEELAKGESFLETHFPDPGKRAAFAAGIAKHSVRVAKGLTRNQVTDHVADLVVAAIILLVVVAIARKGLYPSPPVAAPIVRVAAEGGIQPFHVIRESDLTKPGATTDSVAAVVGRYSAQHLARGAVVNPAMLSASTLSATELSSLRLLQVTFAPDASLLGLKPPVKIALAASSPAQTPTGIGIVVEDVFLLHLQAQNDRIAAVIATTPGNVERLAPFLAAGRIAPVVPSR